MAPVDAIKTLKSYGYAISSWQYTSAAGADGKVIGTQPPAGTPLSPGSAVSVTVNGTRPP
jgi:beta-lactam-binding protein with PASTA domain